MPAPLAPARTRDETSLLFATAEGGMTAEWRRGAVDVSATLDRGADQVYEHVLWVDARADDECWVASRSPWRAGCGSPSP